MTEESTTRIEYCALSRRAISIATRAEVGLFQGLLLC